MGHYDECRPGYCAKCGQTEGNCEHTKASKVKEKQMFRGLKKSEMSPKNFGVGSKVLDGHKEYLVICHSKSAALLSLDTFIVTQWTSVEDENFMSQDEVRELVKALPGTFTDYDYDPKGMKK